VGGFVFWLNIIGLDSKKVGGFFNFVLAAPPPPDISCDEEDH